MLKVVFQVSAMELKFCLDLTEIFCDVDDFYQSYSYRLITLTMTAKNKFLPEL